MQEFVNRYYDITNNPKDKVHKDAFLEHYRVITNLKMMSWQNLLNDVKRIGLNYQKNLSTGGLQGCIVGIKAKKVEELDNDEGFVKKQCDGYDYTVEEDNPTEPIEEPVVVKKTVKAKKAFKKEEVDFVLGCFD